MVIDTSFDFRTDTPPGMDPDAHSPTLRRYHKLLWSKKLPRGEMFELDERGRYLHHRSELGEFFLCIRRHYLGQPSSLDEFDKTLARYRRFFALFKDFRGYVDFFLLQDLVTDDYSTVRFFMPFDNFKTPSWPQDGDTYREYRHLSIEFIKARNRRIGGM